MSCALCRCADGQISSMADYYVNLFDLLTEFDVSQIGMPEYNEDLGCLAGNQVKKIGIDLIKLQHPDWNQKLASAVWVRFWTETYLSMTDYMNLRAGRLQQIMGH